MSDPNRLFSFFGLLLVAVAALPASARAAAAADDDAGQLLAAVRAAVADGRVEQSRVLGFTIAKKQFSEAPEDGGVLTGFDIGLGKFFDIENVYAVRAVYQTRHGDLRLQEHGLFRDKRLSKGKTLRPRCCAPSTSRPGRATQSAA